MAGVGGKTIAEAKNNLSWSEFLRWVAYREQYGTLTMQKRLERVSALFFHYLLNGKVPLEELLIFSEPQGISIDEAINTWT